MWFVTNKKNDIQLKVFEEKVITPFFEELIHYKKTCFTGSFSEYFKVSSNYSNVSNQNIFKIIANRKLDKLKFSEYMDDLVYKYNESEIKYYHLLYKLQNNQLSQSKKEISYKSIPKGFVTIFNGFFYTKFFDDDKVWDAINGSQFSRKIFHDNFKLENHLFVCPYCDIDTTINSGNNQIEHFFPKSKYPFLSMNALNLISSCSSCNMPYEGKGAKSLSPITSPYIEQIGDRIAFDLDLKNRKIQISTSIDEISNYITLLQLDSRYEANQVFKYLLNRGESLYASLIRYEIEKNITLTSNDIIEIIEAEKANDKKNIPLYFATVDIFKDFDRYNSTKDK